MDASAVVTLFADRPYGRDLRAYLKGRQNVPMATSSIGFIEAVRTLDQYGDFPHLMRDLDDLLSEMLLTDEVRRAAAAMPGRIRTLDAIHVASAQALGDTLDVLVSYDKRMLEVAEAVGLPTAAPGFK
ncbi:type II toxin-antitoxin system VapC family toxin [Streptomyces sp. NPDC004031]